MTVPRRLLPDLSALQVFECAARHGSFTRAALELSLTQSAISRQIKELETRLGVTLFERVRQRVVLSQTGRRFLPEARRLLSHGEEAVILAMAGGDSGSVLSIATLPTFGARWLTPRLPGFQARHPDIVLNVASRSQRFDFNEEHFDLAVHYGEPVWAGAHCIFLCSEIVVPVADAELAASAERTGLSGLPLLHLATRPKLWADWFARDGRSDEQVFRGNRFDQFAMIIEAAAAGMGVALLPLYLIEAELASGRLHTIAAQSITTDKNYYLVVPEGKTEHQPSKAFQSWLLEQVPEKPE